VPATDERFNGIENLVCCAVGDWLWAMVTGHDSVDPVLLLVFLGLAIATALITALAIFREHHDRIDTLRREVTHQLLGFAAIWLPAEYQKRVVEACVPSRDLHAANFEVLMPVYGTLDTFLEDMKKLRERRRRSAATAKRRKPAGG